MLQQKEATIPRRDRLAAFLLCAAACSLAAACSTRPYPPEGTALETRTVIDVARPVAGESLVVTPGANTIYRIDASEADPGVEFESDDLVLRYPDNGRIVFQGIVALAEAGAAPALRVGDVDIGGDMILGQAMAQTDRIKPLVTGVGPLEDGSLGDGPVQAVVNLSPSKTAPALEAIDTLTAADQSAETAVQRPVPGRTLEIETVAGARYVIDFDPTAAQVQIDGNDFLLVFEDGGTIVFENLVGLAQSGQAPVLQVGGVDIGGDVILGQAVALSGEQATLETAAGDTGSASLGSNHPGFADYMDEKVSSSVVLASAFDQVAPGAGPQDNQTAHAGVRPWVFYAATRLKERIDSTEDSTTGPCNRKDSLDFGRLRVAAPKLLPEVAGPWSGLDLDGALRDEFTVVESNQLRRVEFGSGLEADADGEILLFVHGPGVPFEQAARRIVQIAHDRGFRGTLVLYSWPVDCSEAVDAWIGHDLNGVLKTIRSRATETTAVHVLAHRDLAAAIEAYLGPPSKGSKDTQALYWRYPAKL